jgi:hypothetical protein
VATVHPRGVFRGLHDWWVHLQIGLCELDQDLVAFRTPVSAFHDVLHYRDFVLGLPCGELGEHRDEPGIAARRRGGG